MNITCEPVSGVRKLNEISPELLAKLSKALAGLSESELLNILIKLEKIKII